MLSCKQLTGVIEPQSLARGLCLNDIGGRDSSLSLHYGETAHCRKLPCGYFLCNTSLGIPTTHVWESAGAISSEKGGKRRTLSR